MKSAWPNIVKRWLHVRYYYKCNQILLNDKVGHMGTTIFLIWSNIYDHITTIAVATVWLTFDHLLVHAYDQHCHKWLPLVKLLDSHITNSTETTISIATSILSLVIEANDSEQQPLQLFHGTDVPAVGSLPHAPPNRSVTNGRMMAKTTCRVIVGTWGEGGMGGEWSMGQKRQWYKQMTFQLMMVRLWRTVMAMQSSRVTSCLALLTTFQRNGFIEHTSTSRTLIWLREIAVPPPSTLVGCSLFSLGKFSQS